MREFLYNMYTKGNLYIPFSFGTVLDAPKAANLLNGGVAKQDATQSIPYSCQNYNKRYSITIIRLETINVLQNLLANFIIGMSVCVQTVQTLLPQWERNACSAT